VSHCLQFRAWLLRSLDGSEGKNTYVFLSEGDRAA
jgi:hypothetical protein